jgi:ABC-2 type transport system permease protein
MTATHVLTDSATMLRRDLKHLIRYPSVTIMLIGMPVVFLLMFVYVLGGTLGSGIGDGAGGRQEYLAYVLPGILVIARAAVLTGHVGGSTIQTALGLVMVSAVAVVMGYRAAATLPQLIAVVGVLAAVTLALTWLTVAMGMASGSVESASNTPMILFLLPFLSSGFVPTETMPAGARWFADHQPSTPFIESIRGLLAGEPAGQDLVATALWCAAITLGSYVWARRSYERRSVR